jgi:hypothetical protein
MSVGPGKSPQLTIAGDCRMRERGQMRTWGAWDPRCVRGGRFGARNRKSRPSGTISVGTEENPQLSLAGGCGMRERG